MKRLKKLLDEYAEKGHFAGEEEDSGDFQADQFKKALSLLGRKLEKGKWIYGVLSGILFVAICVVIFLDVGELDSGKIIVQAILGPSFLLAFNGFFQASKEYSNVQIIEALAKGVDSSFLKDIILVLASKL